MLYINFYKATFKPGANLILLITLQYLLFYTYLLTHWNPEWDQILQKTKPHYD